MFAKYTLFKNAIDDVINATNDVIVERSKREQ